MPIRFNEEGRAQLVQAVENLQDGEVFLVGGTYHEQLTIQADELHLMFCYHDELHKAERDYGDEAYQLLDEIYQKGAELDLPTDLRERIKAIVDGDECTRHDDTANVGGTKPAKPGSIDWLSDDNVAKLREPEVEFELEVEVDPVTGKIGNIIPNVVIKDNRKG